MATPQPLFEFPDDEDQDLAPAPWKATTRNGFPLNEVVSAIQKTIRRGLATEAAFWAMEANASGYGAYVWRRLMVITSEDVGLADPQAPVIVSSLYQMSVVYNASSKKQDGKTIWPWLMLLQATVYLARAPKSRELAFLESVLVLRQQRGQVPEMPDYARDMHTAAGRQMGRGLHHFMDEGARLSNEVEIEGGDIWRPMLYGEWTLPKDPSQRTME